MGEGSGRRFLLLYGSQTGQAKAIAERVRDLARERGLYPDIHCISQSEKEVRLIVLNHDSMRSKGVRIG